MSNQKYGRVNEWDDFSNSTREHIKSYTVNQYKDMDLDDPDNGDQAQKMTLEQLQSQILRYANRMNSGQRGKEESIRDLLKIAHYSAITWGKYQRGELSPNTEQTETYTIDSVMQLDAMLTALKGNWPCKTNITLKFN